MKRQKIYEKLCRMYVLHSSFKVVSKLTKIKRAVVKRVILELRSLGADIACNLPIRLSGYKSNIVKEVNIDRLNTIIKIARRLKRINKRMITVKEESTILRLKSKTKKRSLLLA